MSDESAVTVLRQAQDERMTEPDLGAKIKVVGVGGGGGNALNTMIEAKLGGVDFVAANTDLQALNRNMAPSKVQLGQTLTKGLGAGADPEIGRKAAVESADRITELVRGADMVFVTAGMGGGTGTGGAPVIAQLARQVGALTVGVVTRPFLFEGRRRSRKADEGLEELKKAVDALIVIPNNKLLELASGDMPLLDSFKKADEVLLHAVQGISDLITKAGIINVDFADVKTIMTGQGMALMGTGIATGPDRALEAAQAAVLSPLLDDVKIDGAIGILINITGGRNMTLREVNAASSYVQALAHEDANIIFGSVIDEGMGEAIKVTVIATGFDGKGRQAGRRTDELERGPVSRPTSHPRRSWSSDPGLPVLETARTEVFRGDPGARQVRRVTAQEAASQYGRSSSQMSGPPQAAMTLPPSSPPYAAVPIDIEDEYDVPAFQRRAETMR